MDIITDVPDSFMGAWQRIPPGQPHTFWLQSRRLYAYLTVPAGRPDFSRKSSLAECSLEELLWLAGQDGAAGTCIIEEEVLHRRRQIDYSPTRGKPFLRRMRRHGMLLHEESLRGTEQVAWQNLSGINAEIIAFRFQDESLTADFAEPCKGVLLIAGDHFMFARDRGIYALHAESLQVLAECKDYGAEELIPLLDFEISYGLRSGGTVPWEIKLSTLPFREGKALLAPNEFEAIAANWQHLPQKIQRDGTIFLRHWSLDEWSQPPA
jgi:hypothetical protein